MDEHGAQEAAGLGDALARHRAPVLQVFSQSASDLRRIDRLGLSMHGEGLKLGSDRFAPLLAHLDGLQDRREGPGVGDGLGVAG